MRRAELQVEVPSSADDEGAATRHASRRTENGWRYWAKAKGIRLLSLQPAIWQQLQNSPTLDTSEQPRAATAPSDEGGTAPHPSLSERMAPTVSPQPPLPPSMLSPTHRTYLGRLKAGVRAGVWSQNVETSLLGAVRSKARAASEAAKFEHAVASKDVVTELGPGHEGADVEYWKQGDASLHTEEALRQRFKLRAEPRVVEELQRFWEAALRSIQSGEDASAHSLSYEGYAELLRRVYRVLIEEWDPADAEECIAEDWQNDAKGEGQLGREGFMDALFELADTWCKSIAAEE